MIIVDYGDLLKPVGSYREKRNELESIYEGLRALAQEFECPIWTASQTNRSGLNAEVITMESISEAFSKCFVADMIFSVSRTIEDKNTNQGRIFVAKNRNGPDGLVFPIFMDTSRVKIKILDAPIVSDERKPVNKLVEVYQKSKKEFNSAKMKEVKMQTANQILSDITVHMKYARYLPKKERRETWKELVSRNKKMHIKSIPS